MAPFVVVPGAVESFRTSQRMAAEWLALASLLPLALGVASVERPWARLLRQPVVRALAPLLAVATVSLATTAHPLHVREALADLWIGAAALVGWTLGFTVERRRRLLDVLVVPGVALALLGILQLHGWQPLAFHDLLYDARLEMTSLAGTPGDLGVYLVLPCLVAQANLASGRRRWPWAAALGCCAYALAGTGTLTAAAALLAGSALLWARVLPRRRLVAVAAVGAIACVAAAALVAPLRTRVLAKVAELRSGDVNELLTGRLDGWRVAAALLGEHPLAGVGHGAYRAEFARTKLELLAAGTPFYEGHVSPSFANAHNEPLEVGADLGWPGLLALAWGVALLARTVWRHARAAAAPDSGLLLGGSLALGLLCLAQFPFRVALVAFPWLAFLAWAAAAPPREVA